MELAVVKYIKEHGLDNLCAKYSIAAKRHGEYPNLVLLKYDQLESPFTVEVVRQCRGIILDEANDWKVVCYSYEKFGNYGEGYVPDIDWSSAKVLAKEDGSIIQLFYYNDKWMIATSGSPDASGQVDDHGFTFTELFWRVWNELEYQLPKEYDQNKCYAFELLTPYNRVVVRHKKNRLVLHGARNLSDFKQLNPIVEGHHNNWEVIKAYQLKSLDEVMEVVHNLDPLSPDEGEGFVVVDGNYNRVKIKNKRYLAMAHLKESAGSSKRQLLELVRVNEGAEFLTAFEEYRNDYNEIRFKFERMLGRIEGMWDVVKSIDDRKEFAMKVKDSVFSGALFAIKHGKINSFKTFLAEMNIKNLEDWLDKV